jgi:hypothetical protein
MEVLLHACADILASVGARLHRGMFRNDRRSEIKLNHCCVGQVNISLETKTLLSEATAAVTL